MQNTHSQAHVGNQPSCQKKACKLELPCRAFQLPLISETPLALQVASSAQSVLPVTKLDSSKSETGSTLTKECSTSLQTVQETPKDAASCRVAQILVRLHKFAPSSLRICKPKKVASKVSNAPIKRDKEKISKMASRP